MKIITSILAGMLLLSAAPAMAEDADTIRQLMAENKLLRAQIQSLRAEIAQLKNAADPNNKATTKPVVKPMPKPPASVTRHELTPSAVKTNNFIGADLLLDGFVADMRAENGQFSALFLAGEVSADGDPIIVFVQRPDGTTYGSSMGKPRGTTGSSAASLQSLKSGTSKAKTGPRVPSVVYQIHVRLSGPIAADLKPSERPRTLRGFIEKIEHKETTFWNRIGNRGVYNTFKTGTIITVTFRQVTIK